MKIAIIGSGIAGLVAARELHKRHDIVLFEAESRLGGHTATVDIRYDGIDYAIDTGFIVYNDRTYPNFIRLLDEIGVKSIPTEMSFSVHCDLTGLEYAGSNLNTLFAQRRNLVSPPFYRLLADIVRFNREAPRDLEAGLITADTTLGEYLERNHYSNRFKTHYLIPMGAAIWSASTDAMLKFPLQFFVRFFKNHGLLQITDRPQWRVIEGGSRSYIEPLVRPFRGKIALKTPIKTLIREGNGVVVVTQKGGAERFDGVVLATHSDQALRLLEKPTQEEQAVLGAIPYQNNEVILHTDTHLLPRNRRAWASWNYHLDRLQQERAVLTYNMNTLQRLDSPHTFCVTLNDSAQIDPRKILGRFQYAHPVFTLEGIDAQERWQEINGVKRTWFCGAYWQNGFHEDGVVSALRVVEDIDKRFPQTAAPRLRVVSAA